MQQLNLIDAKRQGGLGNSLNFASKQSNKNGDASSRRISMTSSDRILQSNRSTSRISKYSALGTAITAEIMNKT